MVNQFTVLSLLIFCVGGTITPVQAAQRNSVYPSATKRVTAHALIQKVAQLEVQYDRNETRYSPAHPVQQETKSSLRLLRSRLVQLRPDGYRREVTQAVRHALTTQIAAQEVEAALAAADNRQRQNEAEVQLLNLRQHLAALPHTPYAEDKRLARL